MSKINLEPIIKYVLEQGKRYEPALLPSDIPRGQVGFCYDQSMLTALRGKYRYVEGIARNPNNFGDEWVLHAWLTDGTHAFDPTWRAFDNNSVEIPLPFVYCGVELDIYAVADFVRATGYGGIFANAWRHKELARRVLVDIPVERIQGLPGWDR